MRWVVIMPMGWLAWCLGPGSAQAQSDTVGDFRLGAPEVEVVKVAGQERFIDGGSAVGRSYIRQARLGADVACGDLDGDGLCEIAAGAPQVSLHDPETGLWHQYAGRVEVYRGTDRSPMASIPHPEPVFFGQFGSALEIADFDQDGFGDLAITGWERGAASNIAVWVYHGPDLERMSIAEQPLPGGSDALHWSIDVADINADGFPDFVYGNPFATDVANGNGAFFIYYGPELSQVTTVLRPDSFTGFFGSSISAGDLNGDGFMDVVAGDPFAWLTDGTPQQGRAWVYYGPDFTQYDTFKNPDGVQNILYGRTTAVGDYNHDGVDDLAVSAPQALDSRGYYGHGAVWIYWGPDLKKKQKTRIENVPEGKWGGEFGNTLESADANQDGIMDLVVGATGTVNYDKFLVKVPGELDVLYGPDLAHGLRILSPADEEPQWAPFFGRCVDFGDVTGDGLIDFVAGASNRLANAGAVYYVDLSGLSPFASYRVPGEGAAEPSMRLTGAGSPSPGRSVRIHVSSLPPGEPGWLWVAEKQTGLPLHSDHLTMDGQHYLLLEPPWFSVPLDQGLHLDEPGGGDDHAVVQLDIPADPNLYGLRLRMQAFAADARHPVGFRESNGLIVTIWEW